MSKKKLKTEASCSIPATFKLDRRSFMTKLALLGAGAAAYSSPKVSAAVKLLSEPQTVGRAGNYLDIQLPAAYKIEVPPGKLTVTLKTGQSVPVEFKGMGNLVLSKATDPSMAEVRVLSLRMDSTEKEPFAKFKLQTGPIVAEVPKNTVVGLLNLKTGELRENPVQVNVSLPQSMASAPGRNSAQVKNVLKTETKVAGCSGGSGKCRKCNDVKLDLSPMKTSKGEQAGSTTTGSLLLSFIAEK